MCAAGESAAAPRVARFPAPGGGIADAGSRPVLPSAGRAGRHPDSAGPGRGDRPARRRSSGRSGRDRRRLRAAIGRGVALERQPLSRFTLTCRKVAEGLWFPVSYGTEFHLRVLFGYARTVTMSLDNRDFRRASAESTIHFENEPAKPW